MRLSVDQHLIIHYPVEIVLVYLSSSNRSSLKCRLLLSVEVILIYFVALLV